MGADFYFNPPADDDPVDRPKNPGNDVPPFDDQHDGYVISSERTAMLTTPSGKSLLFMRSALNGLRIEAVMNTQVVLQHGKPGTLEILEELHGVITESLKREKGVLALLRERRLGPDPDAR